MAIFAALFLVVTGIKIPQLLDTGLQKIGATASPLAMIYVGGVFACIDIRRYIKELVLYGIVLVKMLLIPVIMYGILNLFPISDEIHLTMALIAEMPAMTSVVMMANSAGSDGDYALGGVFVTTICSIVTLPFICWLLQYIL